MRKSKYLTLCTHGLSVVYPVPEFTSGMPMSSCGHVEAMFGKEMSIDEVIAWVESVKQPKWHKIFHLGKWQFSLVRYWK